MVLHFGGGTTRHKTYSKKHKKHWSWRLRGKKAVEFLTNILPHMVEHEKVRRASILVNRYHAVTPRNGKYTPEMDAKRKELERDFFSFSRSPALVKNGGPGEESNLAS